MQLIAVALFIFANVIGINAGTSFDASWTQTCPAGQSIDRISSQHSNHHEDRTWSFYCKSSSKISSSCHWSGYVNSFDQQILFQCASGVITGVQSYHSNHHEDRRFNFKCCNTKNNLPSHCSWTDFANDWDGAMDYYVKYDHFLVGAYSVHSNSREDRRWKFLVCQQG